MRDGILIRRDVRRDGDDAFDHAKRVEDRFDVVVAEVFAKDDGEAVDSVGRCVNGACALAGVQRMALARIRAKHYSPGTMADPTDTVIDDVPQVPPVPSEAMPPHWAGLLSQDPVARRAALLHALELLGGDAGDAPPPPPPASAPPEVVPADTALDEPPRIADAIAPVPVVAAALAPIVEAIEPIEPPPPEPAPAPVPVGPPTHFVFNDAARVVGRFHDPISAHAFMRRTPAAVGTLRLPSGQVTGYMAPYNMSVRRAEERATRLAFFARRHLR